MKTEHITAYALGELRDDERGEFEKELSASLRLRNELDATNAICDALVTTPGEELGGERRARLLADCAETIRKTRRHQTIRKIVFASSLTALAACLLIAPMLPWTALPVPALEKADFSGEAGGFVRDETPPVPTCLPSSDVLLSQAVPTGTALMASADTKDSASSMSVMAAPTQSLVLLASTTASPGEGTPVAEHPAEGKVTRIKAFTAGWGKGSGSGTGPAGSLPSAHPTFNTETYDAIQENGFLDARTNPLSTFSIDVDTASYANVRRFLNNGQLPPTGAVRIEELINYFPCDYPEPDKNSPFSVSVESAAAPWAPEHELVRIGLHGRNLDPEKRPASNLVFLVDVSGSMQPENKLPLLRRSLRALVEKLDRKDSVAIVVYAGSSGLVLPATRGTDRQQILEALDRLDAGGSTNGAQGITLAYETARKNFLEDGNNRVILCTDGDFNVGVTDQSSLVELIEKERSSGIFLSVLGFGEGNLKDSTMEKLADKGNGNYAYIDSFSEGRKVLVEQMAGTLFTIAKDVKIQVEFNPARVAGYRLIGYENRLLAKEDFNNDKKDAGEIGAGHTVTAFYEVVPAGKTLPDRSPVDALKYQSPPLRNETTSGDLLTLKLRYKAPAGDTSRLIETPFQAPPLQTFDKAGTEFQFAAAVAAFGMKLRGTPGSADISWTDIQTAARRSQGEDPGSHRAEFLTLVEKARQLSDDKVSAQPKNDDERD